MPLSLLFPSALLTLLAATAGAASAQTTWHVDIQAAAPGDGSPGAPYASLAYALAQAATVDGDTLLVAPGSYPGPVSIVKGVTVRASEGPSATRIRWVPGPNPITNAVALHHAQARLEGFTVQGALPPQGSASTGVTLSEGATLARCIVTGFLGNAYAVEVFDGRMDHCTVTGNDLGIVGGFGGFIIVPLELSNSIVAGNGVDLVEEDVQGPVNYCAGLDEDPKWWNVGVGNLPIDPQTLFGNWGDPHLAAASPCIDAGSPASALDPDGSIADIGALPFDFAYAPGPKVYCTGKLHSEGCVADIGFQGLPSLSSAQPFLITASEVPAQKVGLLFYGFGPRAAPLWGGTHCVQPPTPRTTGQFSGGAGPCTGSFAFDFQAWMATHGDLQFVPGAAVYAQYWFRDPADPQGFGVAFSDALSFHIAP